MRSGAFVLGLASALAMAVLLSAWVPPATAAVEPCEPADVEDASGDVDADVDLNQVTGFDRIDLLGLCVAESADAILFIITVSQEIGAGTAQEYTYTLAFVPDNGTAPTCTFTRTSAGATSSEDCPGEADGARLQFSVAKSALGLGTGLSGFAVDASGEAPAPAGAGIVTGSDRMPDSGTADFAYTVGARAPAGTDTDGDGVDDADEIAAGTDPESDDSDGDGVTDGAEREAGTNATSIDSDRDGLLDGPGLMVAEGDPVPAGLEDIVNMPMAGGTHYFGEADVGTDPTSDDTDGDGLTDGDELRGASGPLGATYADSYRDDVPEGATDPARADTDADGLTDLEESTGTATIDGQTLTFTPTNPNLDDTDRDGLLDGEEIRGLHVSPAGQQVRFSPTDPTQRDTDADGFDDFFEAQQGTDPADAGSKPVSETGGDVVTYLPLSIAFLAALVLVSAAGILWRWG